MIHSLSDVQSKTIGKNTTIWQYSVVLERATIGDDCNICAHVFIENEVMIDNRVTIKCGVQVYNGITIEDDVFIGPNVTLTNDKHPVSRNKDPKLENTIIKKRASIGGGAVILPGLTIGEGAIVGAGSVVTKDVPAGVTVVGNPARKL